MNKEAYDKAKQLNNDIRAINYNLRKIKEDNVSIIIQTPFSFSSRLEREFIEWLEEKADEYQKEFDEL
ncbi:hypothetical protein HMPREF0490_00779 [Lachnospiraceae bacterium 6_1_37FAA]|nr:hypothetical protein HMPREF0490_00779 [Lachnospiraceae bacterium 6_1_37FAA]